MAFIRRTRARRRSWSVGERQRAYGAACSRAQERRAALGAYLARYPPRGRRARVRRTRRATSNSTASPRPSSPSIHPARAACACERTPRRIRASRRGLGRSRSLPTRSETTLSCPSRRTSSSSASIAARPVPASAFVGLDRDVVQPRDLLRGHRGTPCRPGDRPSRPPRSMCRPSRARRAARPGCPARPSPSRRPGPVRRTRPALARTRRDVSPPRRRTRPREAAGARSRQAA